jgi:Starch synthase catalytic domain
VVGGRVLFVVSEFEDYVRVGGLASVAAALSRALRSFCDIRICIPGYRAVLSRRASKLLVGARRRLGSLNVMSAFFTPRTECRFTYYYVMSCTIEGDRLIRMSKGQTGKTTIFASQDLLQLPLLLPREQSIAVGRQILYM